MHIVHVFRQHYGIMELCCRMNKNGSIVKYKCRHPPFENKSHVSFTPDNRVLLSPNSTHPPGPPTHFLISLFALEWILAQEYPNVRIVKCEPPSITFIKRCAASIAFYALAYLLVMLMSIYLLA
jgi:hypothetical protein